MIRNPVLKQFKLANSNTIQEMQAKMQQYCSTGPPVRQPTKTPLNKTPKLTIPYER